jgi:hypothetical protein
MIEVGIAALNSVLAADGRKVAGGNSEIASEQQAPQEVEAPVLSNTAALQQTGD